MDGLDEELLRVLQRSPAGVPFRVPIKGSLKGLCLGVWGSGFREGSHKGFLERATRC